MMKLTIEEVAEILKKNKGDIEATKQAIIAVQEGVVAQHAIEQAINLIIVKSKLDPIQSACSISIAAIRELDLIGKFFKKSLKEREEFVRSTLSKTLETIYKETEEEEE